MQKIIAALGEELINRENARHLLPTPALILDLNALEENIQWMAHFAREKKIALRPHFKGHKSIAIARLQIEAGALGISCATLGEADVLVRGKIPGVLITSPIVTADKIARLIQLNQEAENLMVVVDNLQNIKDLARAQEKKNKPLQLLIDFDIGQNRTGTKSAEEAVALAKHVQTFPGLKLVGLQAYGGHMQHIGDYAERQRAIQIQNKKVSVLGEKLRPLVTTALIVTGGGTGTFALDAEAHVYTELQPGSYLFMDVQYSQVALLSNQHSPFQPALFVLASVVSSHPDFAIVDAGLKAFATDGPSPRVFAGASEGSTYAFMGDEHGKIQHNKNAPLSLGHKVEFLTPHCDPTVNLYDFYHCVRGNTLVSIWPIDARGLH